jgi:hypothetical protein
MSSVPAFFILEKANANLLTLNLNTLAIPREQSKPCCGIHVGRPGQQLQAPPARKKWACPATSRWAAAFLQEQTNPNPKCNSKIKRAAKTPRTKTWGMAAGARHNPAPGRRPAKTRPGAAAQPNISRPNGRKLF